MTLRTPGDEAELGENGPQRWHAKAERTHQPSLPTCHPSTQQRLYVRRVMVGTASAADVASGANAYGAQPGPLERTEFGVLVADPALGVPKSGPGKQTLPD